MTLVWSAHWIEIGKPETSRAYMYDIFNDNFLDPGSTGLVFGLAVEDGSCCCPQKGFNPRLNEAERNFLVQVCLRRLAHTLLPEASTCQPQVTDVAYVVQLSIDLVDEFERQAKPVGSGSCGALS